MNVETRDPALRDEAMNEFLSALAARAPSAPTWCEGWSAHELAAHVAGAAEERAHLIEEHLCGRPPRATRSWEEREPPLRALPDVVLRDRLWREATRFERAVARLDTRATIDYTGWSMTAERLIAHSHSEAVLHRWDLVGGDDISERLLADPGMVTHALAVFEAIPQLAEARRWVKTDHPGRTKVIEVAEHELPLVLWGRCPARLRAAY